LATELVQAVVEMSMIIARMHVATPWRWYMIGGRTIALST